jgi:hypothetical protein
MASSKQSGKKGQIGKGREIRFSLDLTAHRYLVEYQIYALNNE